MKLDYSEFTLKYENNGLFPTANLDEMYALFSTVIQPRRRRAILRKLEDYAGNLVNGHISHSASL